MGLMDSFLWGIGFGFGADMTKSAINTAEDAYRVKNFDPFVRQDFNDIMRKGVLEYKEYPFPRSVKEKKPPFFIRHKWFCLSFLAVAFLSTFVYDHFENGLAMSTMIMKLYTLFFIGYILVMLVKKILRTGKKVADLTFQTTFINEAKQYWEIRENVRNVLQAGNISPQQAVYHLRNTALGNRLPDFLNLIQENGFRYQ